MAQKIDRSTSYPPKSQTFRSFWAANVTKVHESSSSQAPTHLELVLIMLTSSFRASRGLQGIENESEA